MTKRRQVDRKIKSRQKRHNTAVAEARQAGRPHINLVPLCDALKAIDSFVRQRVYVLAVLLIALSAFQYWNTSEIRKLKAAEPYMVGLCGASRYAEGLGRRFAGETDPAVQAVMYDMSLLAETLEDDCTVHYSGMTRLEAWLRDRKTKSRTPDADPLPRPQGETVIEVASYTETGTAPP